ncbi:MAG: lamin tail domain-containing protein [Dysgonamonadaceae bacterium]|jgi:hypothetical protein|nr:lamin tail domain-containing protein [Dysgonamonadaceae bacterium]
MKNVILSIFFLLPATLFSQFRDDFGDGIFQGSPVQTRDVEWTGDTGLFTVNDLMQLQLNATEAGTAQLRTSSTLSANACWEWWIGLDFNPTVNNYVRIYLVSDTEDFTSPELNGLFVRIGYTDKNICLIQQSAGKNNKTLIKGSEKRLNAEFSSIYLKATIDRQGVFSLYSRMSNESDYIKEGACTIKEIFTGQYFGLSCIFTETRSKKFFFDEFVVRELRDDEQEDAEDPILEGDVLVNEIMFNPPTDGSEWIEICNYSEKAIDLRFLSIATRKPSDGSLNKAYPLATSSVLLNPDEYLVITKDREGICKHFNCREDALYAELAIFPALANGFGTIVILNNLNGEILDEVSYNNDWHSAGINDTKGISLERTNSDYPSNDPSNWHSASDDSGFATPGYENSIRKSNNAIEEFTIVYPQFIIGNCIIRYRLDKPGLRCNAKLFDTSGRLVSIISDNSILGAEGVLTCKTNGKTGILILHLEIYDIDGNVRYFKRPVVVNMKSQIP